jgi:hypothetical protein
LSVIKYNIADFLPDAKISNHAFTVGSREIFVDNLLLFTAREPPIVTIRGDIKSFAAGKSPRI